MTQRNLDNLVRARELKEEAPDPEEIRGLIHSGAVRLEDARNESLGMESRFDLAYNAAHSLSLAALRWHGYRSEKRYLVFQCLTHTVDLPAEEWRVLDEAHRKRNAAEYEGIIDVDESLLAALLRVTENVYRRVIDLGPVTD